MSGIRKATCIPTPEVCELNIWAKYLLDQIKTSVNVKRELARKVR